MVIFNYKAKTLESPNTKLKPSTADYCLAHKLQSGRLNLVMWVFTSNHFYSFLRGSPRNIHRREMCHDLII